MHSVSTEYGMTKPVNLTSQSVLHFLDVIPQAHLDNSGIVFSVQMSYQSRQLIPATPMSRNDYHE